MVNLTAIAFVAIYILEATIIIIGNAFTIFVFSTKARHLKRTCFLLINLAVPDLLVGISEPIVLATKKFHKMATTGEGGRPQKQTNPSATTGEGGRPQKQTNPFAAFQIFASSTSVLFLALVSLERAYAVLWPIRHRVTNTTAYIYSIIGVWAVTCCMFGLHLLSQYHTKVEEKYVYVLIHACLFIALLVICASYVKIRTRFYNIVPELDNHSRQSTERNVRISKTIFIVIAVSLLLWVPAFIVYISKEFCPKCFHPTVVWSVNALNFANSMVNPFVYSFRMQIFKDALKKVLGKKRQNIEVRPVQANRLCLVPESSFTPVMERTGDRVCNELTCHAES